MVTSNFTQNTTTANSLNNQTSNNHQNSQHQNSENSPNLNGKFFSNISFETGCHKDPEKQTKLN